jgi:hypothetical protein
VLLSLLSACALASAPQLLMGARGGVFLPASPRLRPGALAGLTVEIAPFPLRQLALVAEYQRSFHDFISGGRAFDAHQDSAALGVEFRFDVGPVVPYAAALGQYSVLSVASQHAADWSGALGLGFYVPLGRHLFLGAQARYGYAFSTRQFPSGTIFQGQVGYRVGRF